MDQWYEHNDLNGVVNERLIDVLPVEMMESCDEYPSVQDASTTSDFFDETFIAAASKADWDTIEPWSCFLMKQSGQCDDALRKPSTGVDHYRRRRRFGLARTRPRRHSVSVNKAMPSNTCNVLEPITSPAPSKPFPSKFSG